MTDFRLVIIYNTNTSEAKRWKVAADLGMLGIFTAKSEPILNSASYGQVFMIDPKKVGSSDMCSAIDQVNQMVANLYLDNVVTLYGVFMLEGCWRYATGIHYLRRKVRECTRPDFWSSSYSWNEQFVSNNPRVDYYGYMINPLVRMKVIDYSASGHCLKGKCS